MWRWCVRKPNKLLKQQKSTQLGNSSSMQLVYMRSEKMAERFSFSGFHSFHYLRPNLNTTHLKPSNGLLVPIIRTRFRQKTVHILRCTRIEKSYIDSKQYILLMGRLHSQKIYRNWRMHWSHNRWISRSQPRQKGYSRLRNVTLTERGEHFAVTSVSFNAELAATELRAKFLKRSPSCNRVQV